MSLYPSTTTVLPSTSLFPEVGEQIADVCDYSVELAAQDYATAASMPTYASAALMQAYASDAQMQTYASALSATYGSQVSVMAYETAMEAELVLEVCDDD